MTIILIIL